MNRVTLPLLVVLAASAASPGAPAQEDPVVAEQRFTLGSAQSIALAMRSGTLVVTAQPQSNVVSARLALRCGDSPGCARRLQRLALSSKSRPDRLSLGVEGLPRLSHRDTVVLTVELPADRALEIDLGAGEVSVTAHRGQLEIDVGSGHVEVEAERSVMRSVQLDSGLGDVQISLGGEILAGAGLFLGSELRWVQPSGSAQIEVDCGVGDVRVDLR